MFENNFRYWKKGLIFMTRITNIMSKGLGFIYSYLKCKTKKKNQIQNDKVLIIATGHIGNALVDAPAIQKLIDFYKSEKQIYLMCSKELWNAFALVVDLRDVIFMGDCYNYSGIRTYFAIVKKVLDSLKGYEFEKIIVTLTNAPLAHYIVAAIPANESWGIFDDVDYKQGFFYHFFERYYTHKLFVPVDMHEAQRLKLLLKKLGCGDCCTKIQYIPVQMEYSECSDYITIAVDSMATQRRWVSEKFVLLINRLLELYSYDVYLTGSHETDTDIELYNSAFSDQSRVKNFIGKTSFQEWIEMLRHSRFHIGVDSGSIHVAASVGTQAFCMTGVWDGKRCFPYQIDERDDRTTEPICIYRSDVDINEMDCYACKVFRTRIGKGNNACYRECMSGRPCLCIQKIEVEDVIQKIKMSNSM